MRLGALLRPLWTQSSRALYCVALVGGLVSCYISSGLTIQSVSIAANVCG